MTQQCSIGTTTRALLRTLAACCAVAAAVHAAPPTVREYERVFTTYPFSDPNPIPVVGRIYPYFRFDGFTDTPAQRSWKVVELENDYLKVMILPQIGGKIWSAIDKKSGRPFLYANSVVKFRDIAMRGPWTSGGIEANYGIIGHTPNVATPVDYVTRTNADGSVSCIIGAMDLLTRSQWRLEIRLGKDDAAFSTSSFWYNASSLEQPYYSWMNAGIPVAGKLQYIYPGTSYLGHSGEHGPWPIDSTGRDLSFYDNNDFGGYKSYHVFGSATDFFGAFWHDRNFGMVRWSPRDEKPGKKIWIWGLSRQGMIWEKLLTDHDGQYSEVQSGRLFNQAAEQSTFTPFRHRGFAPQTSDRWTEWWYPVSGTKGFVTASRIGALNVTPTPRGIAIAFAPAVPVHDTLRVWSRGTVLYARPVDRAAQQLFIDSIDVRSFQRPSLRITIGDVLLEYSASPSIGTLARPADAPPRLDWTSAVGLHAQGREWIRQREYLRATAYIDSSLARDSLFVPALVDRAMLWIRAGAYDAALRSVRTALSIDTYDAAANYYYGIANRKLGNIADATDGFQLAAQHAEFRLAALIQLAHVALARGDLAGAADNAEKVLSTDAGNPDALAVRIVVGRKRGDIVMRDASIALLETSDPLSHQARLERLLASRDPALESRLRSGIRAELPEQVLLELAAWYADVGDIDVAERVLKAVGDHPEALYWRAALLIDRDASADSLIARANALSPRMVFPFRPEMMQALRTVELQASGSPHWKLLYYRGLASWAMGDESEAWFKLRDMQDRPDYAPAYAVRASLPNFGLSNHVHDLERAITLDSTEWRYAKLLADELLTRGIPQQAIPVLRRYRQRFPANYILGLTLAKVYLAARLYGDADALLSTLSVLPYEGAGDGRVLHRAAKLQLAIQDISASRWDAAAARIAAAREWPERLGSGKPYDADTDERLEDWILADLYLHRGDSTRTAALWSRIAASTRTSGTSSDILPLWALQHLGRSSEAEERIAAWTPPRVAVGAEGAVIMAWWDRAARATIIKRDSLRYGVGVWEADSLGNHRAVVRVNTASDAVLAHIPWRRRDSMPEKINVVVVAAATNQRVRNVFRLAVNREFGDIVFQATVPGEYYVYYMPYTGTFRSNYPKITYRAVEPTGDPTWLSANGLETGGAPSNVSRAMPVATMIGFDAINEFSQFTPMEYIATAAELSALRTANPRAPFLAFAEDRSRSIRMSKDIPAVWAARGAYRPFAGTALRGEYYTFQIGVWAHRTALDSLRYRSSPFRRRGGSQVIPASAVTPFNLEGTDWSGQRFTRAVHVDSGRVQALWFGLDLPTSTAPGDYDGTITLGAKGATEQSVRVTLHVGAGIIVNHGDDAPANLTRLRWLNSQLAADDEVAAPYTPLRVSGSTIALLGRSFTFGNDGMPISIQSYFSPNNTAIGTTAREILSAPVRMLVRDSADRDVKWRGPPPRIRKQAAGAVAWESGLSAGALQLQTDATLEFDGTAEYRVALKATRRTSLRNVRFEIPLKADAAKYMMGLGQKGGYRLEDFHWTWDVAKKNQDAAWLGDVNAGIQFTLKDEHYVRPLNTNFYLSKPLIAPRSWANDGKGGCDITRTGERVLVSCYSGSHVIEAGDSLRFDFRLMITPFKPLDTQGQWSTRFFHAFVPLDSVQRRGANTINVHHANRINPWINYPFIETEAMRNYIDSSHALGLRTKIYYTVRELTDHAPEMFALRSLGDEVLSHGPGGGFSWLQEHLGDDYIAAWHVPEIKDAAVVNSGVSRWHNFYIEGLDWLVKHEHIDGLYLDDVAFDRLTMKRVRKTLDRSNRQALLDLHSANQYNPRDGYASSANLYLEHFPYINRLWFGEYFDYDSRPDYWLVEISGIPFGLMGEMLEKGGNPWRGMTMGMTARLPWAGDPTPLWKAWDDFGIQQSRMHGWWSGADPVKTSDSDVLATTWTKPGSAMIALGSWRSDDARVKLTIDWKALGLDPTTTRIRVPAIEKFQTAGNYVPGADIAIPGGRGVILILERR